jgi:hypothetical protein
LIWQLYWSRRNLLYGTTWLLLKSMPILWIVLPSLRRL